MNNLCELRMSSITYIFFDNVFGDMGIIKLCNFMKCLKNLTVLDISSIVFVIFR